ncbi:MAG: AAA family ATPase [Planctomycetia bacterium]|nr:AAA family ATPase [Planctomycetia bacterium]
MSANDDVLKTLREALSLSPDNLPLWRHVAATLVGSGRFDEAELELRRALARFPHEPLLKIELAKVFHQQGKNSESLVLVEDLVKQTNAPAAAQVLYARLLLCAGQVPEAVARYKLALEVDPQAVDLDLGRELGVSPPGAEPEPTDRFEGMLRSANEDSSDDSSVEVERPRVTFTDVGGMDALKEEIRLKIIYPLERPELFAAWGKKIGGGILLYGPPGCGKTHLARATAGEIRAGFLSAGISEVLDMWIGASERNLRELFDKARTHRPCVLFFDEVDALGSRRSDMRTSAGRHLINQFLSEMDGLDGNNDGLLVLAATNAPWHVDPAFRRPGRFDKVLFVPPPDLVARGGILRILALGKPQDGLDFAAVARKTDGFSGADLKAVVDQAIDVKLTETLKSGRSQPLTTRDLLEAAKRLKPTTQEWFATARNYALHANEGGTYDDVLRYLKLK